MTCLQSSTEPLTADNSHTLLNDDDDGGIGDDDGAVESADSQTALTQQNVPAADGLDVGSLMTENVRIWCFINQL